MKRLLLWLLLLGLLVVGGLKLTIFEETSFFLNNMSAKHGAVLDSLDGVYVYANRDLAKPTKRNESEDGYNIGLEYQCVEFAKRYYYEHFNHKMPYSYGHAKSFFDPSIPDGGYNKDRDLIQYRNLGGTRPEVGDLVVFSESIFNSYGHLAIVSFSEDDDVEIIQQNSSRPRVMLPLYDIDGRWRLGGPRILGWLRKE